MKTSLTHRFGLLFLVLLLVAMVVIDIALMAGTGQAASRQTVALPIPAESVPAPTIAARAVSLLPIQMDRKAPMIMNRACIALAIYAEAPHAGWLEQAMVASTVINATRNEAGASTCEVIQNKGLVPAFAWFRPKGPPWVRHPRVWTQTMVVADAVLSGDYNLGTPGCTTTTRMWPAKAPRPAWALHMHMTCQVGNHKFYSPFRPTFAPPSVAAIGSHPLNTASR